jgi:hypothetical protein
MSRRSSVADRSLLTFSQTRQEHDLGVWKFQRILVSGDPFFVDLPKDRRLVLFGPAPHATSKVGKNVSTTSGVSGTS